jgi:hypothetical protein
MELSDLWGADGGQNSSAAYPGDNADWTSYDQFISALISDIKTNHVESGLVIDIWNEPDGSGFWKPSEDQYNSMWGRGYYALRKGLNHQVLLSGPASASEPHPDNEWWTTWASFIAKNGSIPDQYVWHMEGGVGDLLESSDGLYQVLAQYDLPLKPININEYAVFGEENPSGSAWWIAQLERINAKGGRGNWLSGFRLHDYMASLISKTGAPNTDTATATGYYPVGDYQVYKYYAQNMTGQRIGSMPSPDAGLDTYATVDKHTRRAKILTGSRSMKGTWDIQLTNLRALGLPASGNIKIDAYHFINKGHYGRVDAPVYLNTTDHAISKGQTSFSVYTNSNDTAYAFEFSF